MAGESIKRMEGVPVPKDLDEMQAGLEERDSSKPRSMFSPGKPLPKGVNHRIEYCHIHSRNIVHTVCTNQLDYEIVDRLGEIFDIVTTLLKPDMKFQAWDEFSDGDSSGSDQNDLAMGVKNKKPTRDSQTTKRTAPAVTDTRRKTDMHIHSPAVIHALRSVVKYYPGQSLKGETVIIPYPYAILVHHEKELRDYKESRHPDKLFHPMCPRDRDAYHDLHIVQEFLKEIIMAKVRLEREMQTA
ncbi:hypothetical protein BJ875DRAFT_526948 [Amylocarpus encephaloides]|uniref:Uncharacterized protein n=1 Tax=Amylocarpus encephaloides TaxID=45428 RepID=A0A9P7Y737_9HELO|nr:hypothetical protein BJ875DRAFT_526948 [Amylocarpus encephaloides]